MIIKRVFNRTIANWDNDICSPPNKGIPIKNTNIKYTISHKIDVTILIIRFAKKMEILLCPTIILFLIILIMLYF